MTAESHDRFQRAESIFLEACDLEGADRVRMVDQLARGDDELKRAVLALLSADDAATTPMDRVAGIFEPVSTTVPDVIGGFDVLRVLGEGGMGVVYEAMQRSPRRRVALKVIKSATVTPSALRRFDREAQILAKLQHPGIATVFGSGVERTSTGTRPWVAMELVDGQPLTAFAHRKALNERARIELVRDVCRAVAHAHERGIIHRDIKPGNIFVTGHGQVKVLDFGVAFDEEFQHSTLLTQQGQLVGTLPYMAPEQVSTDGARADVRTDVYAIGLVAYELLTGVRPHTDAEGGAYGLIRAIREDDPSMAGSVNRALRGDVETILAKAMDKSPARRYDSADALADDLDRFLASKPIIARRASAWYQFRKFAKRNPSIVASAAVVFIVMNAALVLIASALQTAQRQRDQAQHDEYVATAMNEFVFDDLFKAADVRRSGDPDVTLLDALRSASAAIPQRFAQSPEVEAELRLQIGSQFLTMNQLDDARQNLEQAYELARAENLAPDRLVEMLNTLSMLYSDTDELDKSALVVTEAVKLLEAHPDLGPELRLDTLVNAGSVQYHSGDIDSARLTFEQAVALGRRDAPEYETTLDAITSLALVYQKLKLYDKALPLHQESLECSERVLGRHHPDTLVGLTNVSLMYMELDRPQEAIPILKEVLDAQLDLFGRDHVKVAITTAMLGRAYMLSGEYQQAEPLILEGYEWMNANIGPEHRYTIVTRAGLRTLYERWGKPEVASRYEEPTADKAPAPLP